MAIIFPNQSTIRASAIVDLISKVQRPWLFKVTVQGEFPYTQRREYTIAAKDDNSAAFKGLRLFEKDMAHPLSILRTL